MAQLINKNTGMLSDEGHSAEYFLGQDTWDEEFFQIVDTGQKFDPLRNLKRQVWFYFWSQNTFYQSSREKHAVEFAWQTLFSASRWIEISADLRASGRLRGLMDRLDYDGLCELINETQLSEKTTATEADQLAYVAQQFAKKDRG